MASNRAGFTLIELLVVVMIVGLLAAIAMQKFGITREASYYTTLKSDLHSLRGAQEQYYLMTGGFSYGTGLADLDFKSSRGVTITMSAETSGQAWSATATHAGLGGTDEGCIIAFGEGLTSWPSLSGGSGATGTKENEGAPVCTD